MENYKGCIAELSGMDSSANWHIIRTTEVSYCFLFNAGSLFQEAREFIFNGSCIFMYQMIRLTVKCPDGSGSVGTISILREGKQVHPDNRYRSKNEKRKRAKYNTE